MLGSLNSGLSGLQQFQQQMDLIGNNIANVNTTGYKSSRARFADTLNLTLATTGSATPMQVGTGVATSSIDTRFSQGQFLATGSATHLAINGQDGMFVVRDTVDDAQYATRDGTFHIDDAGYLVTADGFHVQGFSDPALSQRGDVRIDATGAPSTAAAGATLKDFRIDEQGKIHVQLTDNTEFIRGQVLLQKFQAPQALTREGGNLYGNLAAAGPLAQAAAPGSSGMGELAVGKLELSNVDLTNEFASLITSQRAFQASARMVTTSDQVLQEVVNLVR